MKMSRLFSQTLRETPAEAEIPSHQLLLRAGFIRQLAAGIYSYLPLARRAMTKIETILREEMNAIGGQEITMPVIHPADLWRETGRWQSIDAEMGRFQDRAGRDMVLAMTHEEVIGDLVRKEIRSYRQLPQMVYHIQTKWRDDPRPRAGLLRVREFTMKDSYTLDADWEGLDRQYEAHYQAYFNIFRRCGLEVIAVGADVGMMGGQLAHEYMFLTPIGEDTLILCDNCSYAANRQIATFQKPVPVDEPPAAIKKVPTPECKTIEELATYLKIPQAKTAKAVFLIAEVVEGVAQTQKFIFAIVRGDMEVNETKLMNALADGNLKARSLRPATEDEIRQVGAEPGYASPVGINRRLGCTSEGGLPVITVVDDLIPQSPNLVSGANQAGYHLLNVNYGRDYQADLVADITATGEGNACPRCGAALRAVRGVEVGNIFKLGTRYSESLGCTYQDKNGQEKPVVMGSYGIGVGRLLACIAEAHHDEHGLIWPIAVAPFQVHLILLAGKPKANQEGSSPVEEAAQSAYQQLTQAGIDVLFDDRTESPGVKFNDADLIGLPLRVTIGERSLNQGGAECKRRDREERVITPLTELTVWAKKEIAALQAEINARVVMESYRQ